MKRYAQLNANLTGSTIRPLIFIATGGWGKPTFDFLSQLGESIANRTQSNPAWIRSLVLGRHAAHLLASNARCLLSGAVN